MTSLHRLGLPTPVIQPGTQRCLTQKIWYD